MYTHTRDQQGPAPQTSLVDTNHQLQILSLAPLSGAGCLLAGLVSRPSSETNASIYPSALETGWPRGFLPCFEASLPAPGPEAPNSVRGLLQSTFPEMGLGIARRRPRSRLTPLTPLEVHLLQRLLYPGHRTGVRTAGAIRARLRRRHPGCRDCSQAFLRNAHPSVPG